MSNKRSVLKNLECGNSHKTLKLREFGVIKRERIFIKI